MGGEPVSYDQYETSVLTKVLYGGEHGIRTHLNILLARQATTPSSPVPHIKNLKIYFADLRHTNGLTFTYIQPMRR